MNTKIAQDTEESCVVEHCHYTTFEHGKYCFSHSADLLNVRPSSITEKEMETIRLCVKVQLIFPRF